MKPDQLYHELKEIAAKVGIVVSEQNFRNTGIHVNSGYCKVKDKDHCIINKHLKINKKLDVLGECISQFSYDADELLPEVSEFLKIFKSLAADNEKP